MQMLQPLQPGFFQISQVIGVVDVIEWIQITPADGDRRDEEWDLQGLGRCVRTHERFFRGNG